MMSAADMDGDGDLDVLNASMYDDRVTWHENTLGDGSAWLDHTVTSSADNVHWVHAADIDGDGDLDAVFFGAYSGGRVTWCESTDSAGAFGPPQVLATNAGVARNIIPVDLDEDGDLDRVYGAQPSNEVYWLENTAGDASAWKLNTIVADFPGDGASILHGSRSVAVADIDRDGALDIVTSSFGDDVVVWHKNFRGRFALEATAAAPPLIVQGESDAVLKIVARHNGRTSDSALELTNLTLRLEDETGNALTSTAIAA